MKDCNLLDHFNTHVVILVNQLHAHREEILEQNVVEKVLRSLPFKFGMVVKTIEEAKTLS